MLSHHFPPLTHSSLPAFSLASPHPLSLPADTPAPTTITVDLSGATGDVTVLGHVTVSIPAVAALQVCGGVGWILHML